MAMTETSFTFIKSVHSQKQKQDSLRLVKECYGPGIDQNYEDYYEWQYLQNPVGQAMLLLVYDGEKAIAQQGLLPCKYHVFDQYTTMYLTMNACVSPAYRRKGIMTEMKLRLKEFYDMKLLIGVPGPANTSSRNNQHYPMPLTLLIRPLKLSNYFHNNLRGVLKPFDGIWKINKKSQCQELTLFDKSFDEFDRVTYNGQTIRQVRDFSCLNWRYINNPRRSYRIFITIDSIGKLEGYIVVRITNIGKIKVGLIMDFVCKYNNSESGRNLISTALKFFWSNEVVLASACCFPNNFEHKLLRKSGFFGCPNFLRPHPFTLWVKSFDEDNFAPGDVYDFNKWIFMLGDYETF